MILLESALYKVVEKARKYDELAFIYKDKTIHCSFCGKRQDDVKKLVAGGQGVFICNECVVLCNEIMEEEISTKS